MVRVTTEVDGKKYELVPEIDNCNCAGCAFYQLPMIRCLLERRYRYKCFKGIKVCEKLHGIWKEIKNEDND